jgi:RNA polymerase sigma factor (sigma-70 family)
MIAAEELPKVVRAAARNDQRAWDRLFRAYTPTVRAVARRHRLAGFDQDEVVQRTWIALVRHIERVRDPASLHCWLKTTARRESLQVIRLAAREAPNQELVESRLPPVDDEPPIFAAVRRDVVREALASLPARQRDLLTALAAEPALTYEQVSARVGIPVGSIGPTRQRSLDRMRCDPRVRDLLDEHVAPGRPTRPVRLAAELV